MVNKEKNTLYYASITCSTIMIIVSVLFFVVINNLRFIPAKYIAILGVVLVVLNVLFISISLAKKSGKVLRVLQTLLCSVLSILMIVVGLLVPSYKGKIEQAFTTVTDTATLDMNVYVLGDSEYEKLEDIIGKRIGLQTQLDTEYQTSALEDIMKQLPEGVSFKNVEFEGIFDAAEALYNGEVDAILLSSAFADILADNDDFFDFNEKTRSVYTVTQEIIDEHNKPTPVPNITNTPFVVAVAGNDTWFGNISNMNALGRTDVNILLVVNPLTKKILMITIPRDAYVGLGGNKAKMDKLTHASVYGISAWKKTIESFMDCQINYFIRVNFSSLVKIVNALGGIDIDNPYAFQTITHRVYEGGSYVPRSYYFEAGNIHLNGNQALLYCRERYNLSNGDMGRNAHQAIVLKALINKVSSYEIIAKADSFLDSIKGTFLTDISMDEIFDLVEMQLNDFAKWDIKTYSITGKGTMDKSYAMGGKILYVNNLDPQKVEEAKELMAELMNIKE